ncbi:MAG TPA: hypothetical protein PKM57_07940 [Kiritimatiellia bacterium]|nr:hypothetical protein [Kiritimatiellia bacterium]HPS07578.1 hypothetical protein [Kiritimatiellia bacterium]
METATGKLGDSAKSKIWFVRNEQGGRFGPVDFETLKAWACDGRIGPTNEISDNGAEWKMATAHRELEMDCVAEVVPGSFYGPIHKDAMAGLVDEGVITATAVIFRRCALKAESEAESSRALGEERARAQFEEQTRHRIAELEGRIGLARQQAEAAEKEAVRLRQELADQARQARGSAAALEDQRRLAEQRAAAREEELRVFRKQSEVSAGQARETLCREQERSAELSKRLDQVGAELAETVRRFDGLSAEHQAQATAWGAARRTLEMERQALQSEVTRALAETAARTGRIAQLEAALAEAGRAMDLQRGEQERREEALREEASSARESSAEQRRFAQQSQARIVALTEALDAAKHGLDGDQSQLAALSKELAESRQEVDRLQSALRQKIAREEAARAAPAVEVLDVEPLESEPRPKVRQKRQHEPLEAEVLPREQPPPQHDEPKSQPPNAHGRGAHAGLSLADLEQQARRELERLGAHGPAFFAKKR